jgi:hypothetical protein
VNYTTSECVSLQKFERDVIGQYKDIPAEPKPAPSDKLPEKTERIYPYRGMYNSADEPYGVLRAEKGEKPFPRSG